MATTQTNTWFHSNRYSAEAVCDFCDGLVRHEPWCISRNPEVLKAWEAVNDPAKLSVHDKLILHALGTTWTANCKGKCKAQSTSQ